MARNNGVTVRSAVQKLSDVAVVQFAALVATEYNRYLDCVSADPAGAVTAVSGAAKSFRHHLENVLTGGANPPAVSVESVSLLDTTRAPS